MPKVFLQLCFITLISALPMQVLASDWVESEHFRARLAAVPEGGNTAAVLEIELEEGWHSYGDPPGDAGLPPRFVWEESQNLEGIDITWPPTFEKRELDMFTVNAYEGLVQFPLAVTPEKTSEDVILDLDLQIMVCNEICIPDQAALSLTLMSASHTP